MTVSVAAGLITTAGAAETVLWSDTFNGYTNTVTHTTNPDTVGLVLVDGTSTAANEYGGIEGITLYTTNRADDSSYFQMTEDANGGKALTTNISRFSNAGRGAKIAFNETYKPAAGSDLVLAFKVKVSNTEGTTFDNAIQLNDDNNEVIFLTDDFDINYDEWADVKIVITPDGTTVYVGDKSETLSVTELSSIKLNGLVGGISDDSSNGAQKASSHPFGYPTISLDDMVVYTSDNGAASTVPPAEDKGEIEVKYEVVPVPDVPEGLGLIAEDNINDVSGDSTKGGRLVFINTTEEDATYSDLNTVILSCGTDSSTHAETKWSAITNGKTDPALGTNKYLEAQSNVKSAAGRGPKMEFKKGEIEERENVVAQFAARLHANGGNPAEIIFNGDLVYGDKGNVNAPLAMITTDATADSEVYACSNPLEQGGANVLQVNDNEWFTVKIDAYRAEGKAATGKISVTTADGATTYILGSEDEYATMNDNTKSGIKTLPFISFRSGNSADYYGDGSGSNTTNDIDNIAVYSSNSDIKPTLEPLPNVTFEADAASKKATLTADKDFAVVVIQACYNADGTLKSVPVLKTVGLKAGVAQSVDLAEVDGTSKVMVWDNTKNLRPIASKAL